MFFLFFFTYLFDGGPTTRRIIKRSTTINQQEATMWHNESRVSEVLNNEEKDDLSKQ